MFQNATIQYYNAMQKCLWRGGTIPLIYFLLFFVYRKIPDTDANTTPKTTISSSETIGSVNSGEGSSMLPAK